MMIPLLPFLLDLATIEQPQSQLVPTEHVHDWVVVWREEKELEEIAFIDRTRTPVYSDGAAEYNTVLLRGIEEKADGSIYLLDSLIALNCNASTLAFVDIWEPKPDASGPKRPQFNLGVFEQASNGPNTESMRDAMFRHSCGADWEYGPPE